MRGISVVLTSIFVIVATSCASLRRPADEKVSLTNTEFKTQYGEPIYVPRYDPFWAAEGGQAAAVFSKAVAGDSCSHIQTDYETPIRFYECPTTLGDRVSVSYSEIDSTHTLLEMRLLGLTLDSTLQETGVFGQQRWQFREINGKLVIVPNESRYPTPDTDPTPHHVGATTYNNPHDAQYKVDGRFKEKSFEVRPYREQIPGFIFK